MTGTSVDVGGILGKGNDGLDSLNQGDHKPLLPVIKAS